ncbi:MAG TPA: hypothetical protein VK468_04865, partial [Pyrinomonadaceae bacterium]|nr:hypothetical protein [Pyrinomonadaceae bacterium]
QGYKYYKIRKRAMLRGDSEKTAASKAVSWGRTAERTYYGTLVSGVFSNADLCANYAGMRFYEGLTAPVRIGNIERPPTVRLKNGKWELSAAWRAEILKPFISGHFNEAFNPSLFIPGLRSSVRRIVKKRNCPQWRTSFPSRTRKDYEEQSESFTLWHGEDYGFKHSRKFVTIANTCFEQDVAKK